MLPALALALWPGLASAQAPASVAVAASTTSAVLAQPIVLQAQGAGDYKYSLDLEKSATDLYTIAKVEPAGTNAFKVSVLPLAEGKVPVTLVWDVEGQAAVESAPVVLDVSAPPLDNPELSDIKPPQKARPLLWPWLLLAAAVAAAWWWRRRQAAQAQEAAAAPVDLRPPEAAALEDLEALERSELWPQGRYREFYFRLTEIARVYLERRFGLPATRLTSAELHRQLKQAELDRAVTSALRELFDRADLVKFAKVAPETAWGAHDVETARRIVRETTPKSEPAAQTRAAEPGAQARP